MSFSRKQVVFLSMVALICGACSKSKDEARTEVVYSEQRAQKLIDEGKPVEAAAEYTNIGELLMTPEGIKHADSMLDRALVLDTTNPKANFLSAFTKIILATRHLGYRMEPLQEIHSELQGNMPDQLYYEARTVKKATKFETKSKYSEFVREKNDRLSQFNNYVDLQEHMRTEILPVLERSISKLETVLSSKSAFDVRVDNGAWGDKEYSYSGYSQNQWSNCFYDQSSRTWTCHYYYNNYWSERPASPEQRTADANDVRVIIGALKAMADSIRLATAYSLENLDKVVHEVARVQKIRRNKVRAMSKVFRSIDSNISTRQLVDILKKYPALFTLNSGNELDRIPRNAEHILREIIDLSTMDRELCNADRTNHLVASVCFTNRAVQLATRNLELLAGPTNVIIGYDEIGDPVEVLMDVTALLRSPMQDLKTLLPNKFNRGGYAINFPDPSFGGLFPNGDLIERLKVIDQPGVRHIE